MPFRRPKKSGPWFTDIRPRIGGKPTGERIRRLMPHVKTKSKAIEEEQRIAQEIREGKTIRATGFESFVREHFLPWADQNKKAPQNDHTKAEALIAFFGDRPLTDVSLFDIERYKRERAKSKTVRGTTRTNGTINNELVTLSRILRMAANGGLLKVNPMVDVEPLESATWRTRTLSHEEESRLLKHLYRPEYLLPLVRFALLTGMRLGEMLGLLWEHVRLDRSLIYVVRPKWKDDPRKTEGLPLSAPACDLLSSLVTHHSSPYVFPSSRGTKVFANNMTLAFNQACVEAKVHYFHFHDLRHTFGSRMAEAGTDLYSLQRLMGHADPKMTMRYIHVKEASLRAALRHGAPFLEGSRQHTDTGKLREVG